MNLPAARIHGPGEGGVAVLGVILVIPALLLAILI